MYQHRSDLIIRPAEDPDAPFLMELINIAYRGEQGWTDGLDNIKAPRIEPDDLRARISGSEENDSARRNAPIFVAVLQPEGVVAGCIQPYNSAKDRPHGSNANSEANLEHPLTIQGYIELFAVHPDYQSRGIGKSLLNFALDHMKEAWNVSVCVIYVFEIRPKVLAWYEKLGFTLDGRTVPAYEFQHLMINPDIVLRILEKQL
ncbi:acyl-CoA N-acyltransferase [Sistotremastrum suecicum HHB10207 ss-3]|uniref:Acyl-CoA N-acyltransferase n=1 Tax=Sistotremastrum suecicum HHB10207 ss-3 TaxID=1314776 RepID=A0A166D1S9_9AGAM|nr:acyl-CoA N-acyltransferase [Sistotremastrum suecicum HHB10207 ss-3]